MARTYNVDEIHLQIDNIDFWSPHRGNKGGMRIFWSADIGVGTLDIVKQYENDEENNSTSNQGLILTGFTECMDSQEDMAFTQKLLELLAKKIKIVE